MLSSLNNTRIFLCTEDTDMRKSFSSLCGIIRRAMNSDPLSGALFVFKNRRADRIKAIYWDGDGLAIWYKSLQRGTFRFPDLKSFSSAGVEVDCTTLKMILDGIDLSSVRRQHRFRIDSSRTQPSPPDIARTSRASWKAPEESDSALQP